MYSTVSYIKDITFLYYCRQNEERFDKMLPGQDSCTSTNIFDLFENVLIENTVAA